MDGKEMGSRKEKSERKGDVEWGLGKKKEDGAYLGGRTTTSRRSGIHIL